MTDPALRFMRLLWRVQHELERVSKSMEDRLGVSGPQRFALRVIDAQPDIGPAELAAMLHLHPSTVTGVMRRLERRRLITRVRSKHDARRSHLRVTTAGARLNHPRAAGTVERAVRSTFDALGPARGRQGSAWLEHLANELAGMVNQRH